MSLRPKLPRAQAGRVFLGREDHLVVGLEVESNGLKVKRLSSIPGQGDLVRRDTEKFR